MNNSFICFIIVALCAGNFLLIRAYNDCQEQSNYRRDSAIASIREIDDLRKENALLKADLVIYKRKDVSHKSEYLQTLPYVSR